MEHHHKGEEKSKDFLSSPDLEKHPMMILKTSFEGGFYLEGIPHPMLFAMKEKRVYQLFGQCFGLYLFIPIPDLTTQ